jgi:Thymidylate synthase complementing protein
MRFSLLWSSPMPERTIAAAMRRCYSTKTIEDIETELDAKGTEYWKFLLTKAMQDKSLDVLEHYTMTFILEDLTDNDAGAVAIKFPHLRLTRVKGAKWFLSLNARTLVEMWKDPDYNEFAQLGVKELDTKGVSPLFNKIAFGDMHAS